MWDNVKRFAGIQLEKINCSSLICQHCNLILDVHQICQAELVLGEAMLSSTTSLFSVCLSIIACSILNFFEQMWKINILLYFIIDIYYRYISDQGAPELVSVSVKLPFGCKLLHT